MPSVIVHGGAGAYEPGEEHERGLLKAVAAAWGVLASGGAAVDAVESAVVAMEDDPIFNAGYGSSMNIEGDVEGDASIMTSDMACGAVACLARAANPIRAARLVMERTDHILLAGRGADAFAERMGLPARDLRTERRTALYEKRLAKLRAGEELRFLPRIGGLLEEMGIGTVGAAAVDDAGAIAAATSTGGLMMKLPGRVGDGAVIGAGTYANELAGVSATGHGEPIMRLLLAKVAADAVRDVGVREAIELVLEIGSARGVEFGIVGVEQNGAVAHGFTTDAMSWAWRRDGDEATFLSPRRSGANEPGKAGR